tara:strand:- start:3 stop:1535 length:1533 start_codon:yes stop_codon:yes gene_type:complete
MKKSVKEQTQLSFQLGGVVQQPGTNIGGYVAPTVPTTGFTPLGTAVAPVTPGSLQPQQAATPIVNYNQGNLPTFGNVVGTGGGAYDEIVTYVNDAGVIRQIPHVNGKPIYPVPEGFKKQASPTDVTPDSPLVNTTTQLNNDSGGDNDDDISSTTGSGRLPSVLSLGNLFSNKTSKSGVKGESIFGSGIGVAEKYDASRPSLSGLNALYGVNPNTNLKNNIGDIGNALGIYGTDGINLGAVFSIATGNILGAAGAVSGFGPNTNLGYKEAPTGFGVFSTEDLDRYTRNEMSPQLMENLGIDQMSKQQATQRAQVQRQIGTTLTGRYGFSKGSIDPNTGLVYDVTGRAVNYGGNTEGVDSSFSSGKDWVDAIDASLETGYWGGPLSVDAFNKLSSTGQTKYNAKMALLGHNEAEGGVGGSSPNKGTDTTFKGGDTSTGGKSLSPLGRQDYTGGGTGSGTGSGLSVGMTNMGRDESGGEESGSEETNTDSNAGDGDVASGGSVSGDMSGDSDG